MNSSTGTMALTAKELKALGPYLQGNDAKDNGEWDCQCPLHDDANRSASINVDKRVFACYKGCGGMSVSTLIRRRRDWKPPSLEGGSKSRGAGKGGKSTAEVYAPTSAHIEGWASALLANKPRLKKFREARGLSVKTIAKYKIGWVSKFETPGGKVIAENAYTIPVYDVDGSILNVRFYQLQPDPDRRKIWSVPGMGSPRIYPVEAFADNPDRVIITEGELDALITEQETEITAVTRTAAAVQWSMGWNELFKGKRVYIAQDCDEAGVTGTRKLIRALHGTAQSVVPVRLPYKIQKKHGKDLTDFFNDGYTRADLLELMDEADAKHAPEAPEDLDSSDVSIIETLDSLKVGKPQRIVATVQGKLEPGYSIPRLVELSCTMDKPENICKNCPLSGAGGKAKVLVAPDDPLCLALVDATNAQVTDAIRDKYGALRCDRLTTQTLEHQAVETLFVRPSVDHIRFSQSSDFQSRKITSVGKHDTTPNTTVRITGALQPNPRSQKNEFLSWIVEDQDTSVDTFALSPELAEQLKIFQPRKGQSPLAKRVEIARELAREVTNIHQRDEMHVAMDLTWHSATAFVFDGQPVDRGWVELLVVGDTRTGKSEAAKRLAEHYHAGEIIDCKASSFAGIVGGLQVHGGSGEFTINWGVIPMNDRRLVVLDEAGGMTVEQIAQMSSVRSSGVAKLTKVKSGETSARTRLLWLANPRNSGMDAYLYGVDALKPLIGNPEDVARFTLAMAVRIGEVPLEVINRPRQSGELNFTSDLCSALVMWCWSRTREQIQFTDAAVRSVYQLATETGKRYVEYPPLIQAANVRIKIATLAVAMAASTFSTDETHENVMVDARHVKDAVRFLDHVYGMQSFGYLERSTEEHEDTRLAKASAKKAMGVLRANPTLEVFLRSQTKFKRQDVEEVLGYTREAANGLINQLHEMRMVKKSHGFIVVSAVLHDILRDLGETR